MTKSFSDPFHARSDEAAKRKRRAPERPFQIPPGYLPLPAPNQSNPFGDPGNPPRLRPGDLPPQDPVAPWLPTPNAPPFFLPPPSDQPFPDPGPTPGPRLPLPPPREQRVPHEVDPPVENPYNDPNYNPNFLITRNHLQQARSGMGIGSQVRRSAAQPSRRPVGDRPIDEWTVPPPIFFPFY